MADQLDASSFVDSERTALCDLFEVLGADAPTLSGEWRTHDLAAHLVLRERRPDAGPGLVVGGPARSHTEHVQRSYAERPFGDLVASLHAGPPAWWPARWIPALDVHEWFVHHEDVRRAAGEGPRNLSNADDVLWGALGRFAKLLTRGVEGGIAVETTSGRGRTIRDGSDPVTVRGDVGEVLLRLFGRGVAAVEIDGSTRAIDAFHAAELGV